MSSVSRSSVRHACPQAVRLVLALALLGTLLPAPGQAQTGVVLHEDFDDFYVGYYPPLPTEARQPGWTYGVSSGAGGSNDVSIVSAPVPDGAITGNAITTSGNSVAGFMHPGTTFIGPKLTMPMTLPCGGQTNQEFSFDFRVDALPSTTGSGGYSFGLHLGNEADGSSFSISFDAGGGVYGGLQTTTGAITPSNLIATGFGANEWWHFTLFGFQCNATEAFYTLLYDRALPETTFPDTVGGLTDLTGEVSPPTFLQVNKRLFTGAGTGNHAAIGRSYLDNIHWKYTAAPAPQPEFDGLLATIAEPGREITGMDVDDLGNVLVLRHRSTTSSTSEDYITAYSGGSLVPTGEPKESDCRRNNGVAVQTVSSGEHFVIYLDCLEDDRTNVEFVKIRSGTLDDPNFAPGCEGYCVKDIWAGELDDTCEDCTDRLATLETFPLDYSKQNSVAECLLVCEAFTSWAFTDDEGRVGVSLYQARNNADDRAYADTAPIGASGEDVLLCTTRFDGKDFIYGATASSNVRGYYVDYDLNNDGDFGDISLSQSEGYAGTPATAHPYAIGCGLDRFLTISGAGVVRLHQLGSTTTIQVDSGSGYVHGGAAMDAYATAGAYLRGGRIYIISGATGQAKGDFAHDPCTKLVDLELTAAGQFVYLGCSNAVYLYDTRKITGTEDSNPNPAADTDHDGEPDISDGDVDGDGLANGQDPDTDGDGKCNGANDLPPETPGAEDGCTGGDDDDDNDGIKDEDDDSDTGSGGDKGVGQSDGGNLGGDGDCTNGGQFLGMVCRLAGIGSFVAGIILVALAAYAGYRMTNGHPLMVMLSACFALVVCVGISLLNSWILIALGGLGALVLGGGIAKSAMGR